MKIAMKLGNPGNVYAQELIPCADGTYADPSIGCVAAPPSVASPEASIVDLILNIATFLMTVVAGVAVVTLIVGGIMYAMALGNDEKLQKSKRLIIWSIVGLVIALLARTLAQFVIGAVA